MVRNLPANAGDMRHGFDIWVRKIPWWRKWQPITVFLLGESHGQRSLAGYSPQDDTAVRHSCQTQLKRLCTQAYVPVYIYTYVNAYMYQD